LQAVIPTIMARADTAKIIFLIALIINKTLRATSQFLCLNPLLTFIPAAVHIITPLPYRPIAT